MARPKMRSGQLSELARHVVLPSGLASTGWPAVRDLGVEFGDEFDEWQDGAGRAILAKRADGLYAATVGGVTLSIPRQVAKTFLVGRIVFLLCILFPGLKVLWTAQRSTTSTNTFRSLQRYAKRSKVWPHIHHIRTANGEQEIGFHNGSVLMFGCREQGFGRGVDEIDIEVFDEAQILAEKALEDMVAATNQSRHPHGALLFFMGTPPKPTDSSEAFVLKRSKALSGTADDMVYIEFSADPYAELDDREQWAIANPSFPNRTPLASMLRLRENLGTDEGWRREALGIWDSDRSSTLFEPGLWPACEEKVLAAADGKPFFAVSMTPDESTVTLAACRRRADGFLHVGIVEQGSPGSWFTDRVIAVARETSSVLALSPNHRAGSMLETFTAAHLRLKLLNGTDYTQACGAFFDDVVAGRLRYFDPQPELVAALGRATRKPYGEAWRWSGEQISALVAVTQARYVAATAPVGGKGRVLVLD